MPLGIYISVPFCRSKCSFCNFASGVFPLERMQGYVASVISDIKNAAGIAQSAGAAFDRHVDSIYLGGGTPSLLEPDQTRALFDAIKTEFACSATSFVAPAPPPAVPRTPSSAPPDIRSTSPEITVECAPNSISDASLTAMLESGVSRISFGAQSFVDRETSSVARLHKAKDTVRDVERIRRAGIENISLDLIAGLPHQTLESWNYSLEQVIDLAVPHVSVYMLEVDEDSRLGNQLLAGGAKYHAHAVPDEDLIVRMYERAIERLEQAGTAQYEISNFARPGWESQHNLKYWLRQPYFGFGADAHSMLPADAPQQSVILNDSPPNRVILSGLPPRSVILSERSESKDLCFHPSDLRFAAIEDLNAFERSPNHYPGPVQRLTHRDALEEAMILGLRLNRGLNLDAIAKQYGEDPREIFTAQIDELQSANLLHRVGEILTLTPRGRLLSNEVFERFFATEVH